MRRAPLAVLYVVAACGGSSDPKPPAIDAHADTVCRADGWCKLTVGVPPSQVGGSVLLGLGGTSPSDVYAVGQVGTILHWNGASWTKLTSNTTEGLSAVWAAGANDVWVVGDHGALVHWNGSGWIATTSPVTSGLLGVWGSDASHVWAVGANGELVFYDGTTWTQQTSPTSTFLSGISGSSASDVWAVGGAGTVLHFDGAAWTAPASGINLGLAGLWVASASDAWAVTSMNGHFYRWTGAAWQLDPGGTAISLQSVWGASASDVWAVGWGQPGVTDSIAHWDGSAWATVGSDPIPLVERFETVWGIGGQVWAAGSSGSDGTFTIWHRGG